MIILMGIVGAGKSLQGRLFAEEMGYKWISTGELFRTQLSKERQQELLSGRLIEDQEVIDLVDGVTSQLDNDKKAVLDGFPRTIAQAQWLLDQVAQDRFKIRAVFNLLVPKDIVRQRLLARGRADDNDQTLVERFKEYDTKTLPIIDFFRDQGVHVYEVDAAKSPQQVHDDMIRYMRG